MAVKIQLRRGTAAQWTAANPILAAGEVGLELDTDKRKIGDGVTAWADLAYDVSADDLAGKADISDLGTAAAADVSEFATAEQGGKADSAYDLWPSGDQATDIANLTAAASTVSANGGKVIRLAPGSYDFYHVTPDDIFGLYIVGDGATVTPNSYIYPFSSVESINSASVRPRTGKRGGSSPTAFPC